MNKHAFKRHLQRTAFPCHRGEQADTYDEVASVYDSFRCGIISCWSQSPTHAIANQF
jgi:hypothetical protein